MILTAEERAMLDGQHGKATQKAMQILEALGTIYGVERMIPVSSVQIAGVSYANLGEAGLKFLKELADGGGEARVLTTLNPAGMDVENWEALGISPQFAANQKQVLDVFTHMGVVTTCSCTPYLFGNLPHFGEHIAWAESSAVCYANSVLGARTNREGGPSALAAALTGRTPEYGYHLDERRLPDVTVEVRTKIEDLGGVNASYVFGVLGKAIGDRINISGKKSTPFIRGIKEASVENLKSLCASIATYGGTALFHMEGITPESIRMSSPEEVVVISSRDFKIAAQSMNDGNSEEVDFVSLGCPHLTIKEIAHIAKLLEGKSVTKEFWITTARPTKQIADRAGYTQIIEVAGAKFAADTCCVVAPIKDRFHTLVTDSAKACYYAASKNRFKTIIKPFDEVVEEATR